jgi:hypothetical protein
MTQILTEGLKHMDMEDQMLPYIGIDQYESSIGENDDMITLDFLVKGKAQAEDLAEWFERGYDWVIDADSSPGEVKGGNYVVFVEMNRRIKVPARIIEMLDDLSTLTGFELKDWKAKIKDQEFTPTEELIGDRLELSPHLYRETHPDEQGDDTLNEWKQIAGVPMTTVVNKDSDAIRAIKRQAGLI